MATDPGRRSPTAPVGGLLSPAAPVPGGLATKPWPWLAGLGTIGMALAIGAPALVVVGLLGVFVAAVFYLSPGDATTVLSLALTALFCIHQRFVIEPLGAAGTPAILLGFGCFVWWLATRVNGS